MCLEGNEKSGSVGGGEELTSRQAHNCNEFICKKFDNNFIGEKDIFG